MVVTRSKSKAAKSEASKSETPKVFEKKPWTYWLSNAAVLKEAKMCFSKERSYPPLDDPDPAKRYGLYTNYLRNKAWNSLSDSDKEYFINKALSTMAPEAIELFYMVRRKTLIELFIRKPKGKGKKRWTNGEKMNARIHFMEDLFETYMSDPKIEDSPNMEEFMKDEFGKWKKMSDTDKDVYVLRSHKYGSDRLEAFDYIVADLNLFK
ncbi:unnamed protein product [Amaranthus hypochondriacus]